MMSRTFRTMLFTLAVVCLSPPAIAQWMEQTIHLQPGWNAVFFEVAPQPRECDAVFQGLAVESVWGWNRRFTPVQYVVDANTLLPEQPEWLTYFPPTSPNAFLTNLFIIRGGRPYLIKLGGTQPVDLIVTGRPKIRTIDWISDSFNLVGLYVDDAGPPTVADFFAPAPAHAGQAVYRLGASGRWTKITNPATETIRRGEAYWVFCKGQSTYQGPLSVVFDVADGLDYDRVIKEQTLRIRNASAVATSVTLRQTASSAPPDASLPELAGGVPLSQFEMDIPNQRYGWAPLGGRLTVSVPARGEVAVRLAVRRPAMARFTPTPGQSYLYQSLLEVTDGAGSRLLLPVSSKGLMAPRVDMFARGQVVRQQDPPTTYVAVRRGLWVGNVTVEAVSNPTSSTLNPDPNEPLPVASPFMFRLIVHLDKWGQARLLPQVLQMWREGAWIPNPNDPTSNTFVLGQPGYTVLLTSDSLITSYGGVALRDTKMVGRRISTAAFGIASPLDVAGGHDFGNHTTGPLTCRIVLDYDGRLSPFKHKYHPDHDNLDAEFTNIVPEGWESYTVRRTIALQFTRDDPEDLVTSDWGDETLGGHYTEMVEGLHRNALFTSGTFRLQRISDVDVLNDGKR